MNASAKGIGQASWSTRKVQIIKLARCNTTMSALPRRLLGNTGLEVSVLGFGASPLGSVFEVRWLFEDAAAVGSTGVETWLSACACVVRLQEINEAKGIESVHEAFRLGINFFDTSPFYGTTKSESVSNAWILLHSSCSAVGCQQCCRNVNHISLCSSCVKCLTIGGCKAAAYRVFAQRTAWPSW